MRPRTPAATAPSGGIAGEGDDDEDDDGEHDGVSSAADVSEGDAKAQGVVHTREDHAERMGDRRRRPARSTSSRLLSSSTSASRSPTPPATARPRVSGPKLMSVPYGLAFNPGSGSLKGHSRRSQRATRPARVWCRTRASCRPRSFAQRSARTSRASRTRSSSTSVRARRTPVSTRSSASCRSTVRTTGSVAQRAPRPSRPVERLRSGLRRARSSPRPFRRTPPTALSS